MGSCYFLTCFLCFLVFMATMTSQAKGDVTSEDFHYFCDSNNDRGNYATDGIYSQNLKTALTLVGIYASRNGFFSVSRGKDTYSANAIGQCRGDVTSTECSKCLAQTRANLTRVCGNRKEAIGWYENEKCMLRYSDRTITGLDEIGPAYFVWNLHDAPNADQFNRVVKKLLDGLRDTAASAVNGRKYAASNATGPDQQVIYGLAQCTPDLSGPQCLDCLVQSIAELPRCCNNRIGARIIRPSCYVRYETDFPFFGPPASAP
ncbi:cysteine-rich receptor-like protein kinase 29 [Vigna unguiculata]|nr:cysteine-rich receptor-like protein kinase 29 [Vigna unguiculata]